MVKYLTRIEAADYVRDHFGIPCTTHSLANYAKIGCGPRYHRAAGRAWYDPADLTAWIEERASEAMRRAREVSEYCPPLQVKAAPMRQPNQPEAA
jgi:hypothetical protein